MKVIDIQIYRNKRAIQNLEKRISEHALQSKTGSVSVMKTCFKEWVKKLAN